MPIAEKFPQYLEVPQYVEVSQYLEPIQKYLESHLERLQSEYKIKRGELPPPNEFSQLTEAIESVKSLGLIQEIIHQYRAELGE
ncbi:MAG: hypothetical protein KME46_13825 [Brasilonema angustatum HA4187-MV1]|jgi:hypothetical protein|nr:hypothetical protein [Brasilonema angustatum HA4187-MV1]